MKKIAMIGCGGIGGYHLSHLLQYPDIILAAFCDLIPERAEQFAEKSGGAGVYTDFRLMLEEVRPAAVFVCVPPYAHGDIEFELIRRGIHFFVEKPVALDLKLARSIRDAVQEAGLITAVGFQLRYDNLTEPARDYVANNRLATIQVTRIGGLPGAPWFKKRGESGGQIVEQTIHQFDMIRYCMGEPDMVFSLGAKDLMEVEGLDIENYSATVVRFQNGVLATVVTGVYAKGGGAADNKMIFGSPDSRADFYPAQKLEIYGIAPKLEGTELGTQSIIQGDGALKSADGSLRYNSNVDYGLICDRTFIDAVISGDASKIRSPYADAVKTLAFTLACNESMDSGLPVKVQLD